MIIIIHIIVIIIIIYHGNKPYKIILATIYTRSYLNETKRTTTNKGKIK